MSSEKKKRSDIIPIVNSAWSKSFANVENNVKAIRDRGWVPLTSTILQYPVILASKRESEGQIAIGTVSTLSVPSFEYITNDVDNTSNNATSNKIAILANNKKKDSNTEDVVRNGNKETPEKSNGSDSCHHDIPSPALETTTDIATNVTNDTSNDISAVLQVRLDYNKIK